MAIMCPVVTSDIQKLADKIIQTYPEASNRASFNATMCAEWIGSYNSANGKDIDFVPEMSALINYTEKLRNMDGKSFLYIPESIEYTPVGKKRQTYNIIGTHIYNKDGKEVFVSDSKDRRRIFANLAVQQKRAVVVEHKGKKYVVNKKEQIISVATGDEMKWGEENGDRKEILRLSQIAFREKQKAETTTANSEVATEGNRNKVEIFNGYWTREQVANQQDKIFLFGDNTNDRVSTHYVPSSTQAVIRDLPNAIGIDTKKNRGTGANSYFSDADFDQFKSQVDSALNAAKADGRTIVIPADGIGTGKAMLKEKAPKCFAYLQQELQKLQNSQAGNNSFPVREQNVPKVGITSQLIAHLKDAGINVFDRTQMEKYLKEHPNALLQQSLEEQWEMQDIKAKAIADGTFMKAPNGKPTNLNERQWLQVRTKNFINWFGDWINDPTHASKVVDENGEPLVVYHYTDDSFSIFDNSKTKDGVFYFTDNKSPENIYYPNKEIRKNSMPVFLNLKRLGYSLRGFLFREREDALEAKRTSAKMHETWSNEDIEAWNIAADKRIQDIDIDRVLSEEAKLIIRMQGFQGFEEFEDTGDTFYVVFNPNQIKSATDNNGMFSTENGDIQMFIGKKARTQFEQQLMKARPNMSNVEIKSTLDFLHSLEDNKENTAYIKTAIRWVANKSITLPQDNVKARQAFDLARKKHLDLQKYNTLGELITAPEMQPKKKEKVPFNPDKAKTFSNKRTVTTEGGRIFTVYDVENTEEGQREVCKALAAHYEMSPWCLSTFTATGEPTVSAKKYWNEYNGIPRKIAYEDGRPVAFSSDKPESLGGWHKIDGTDIYVVGEFMPTGETVTAFDSEALSEEKARDWAEKGYIYPNLIYARSYQLTDKGIAAFEKQKQEAWWDMEDQRAQDSLSDSIVSEPRKQPTMEEEDPAMAEYLRQEHAQQEQQVFDDMMEAWDRMTPEERAQEENYAYEDMPFFITPEGEVYGFVDKDGNIYLDETIISPEHPIHEYTHLWDRALAKNNPQLWKKGIELMKKISLWNEIAEDANYGQKWKTMDMSADKLESLIASEVHARLVGENGAKLLDQIAKEKRGDSIVSKLKQWILDAWKALKATFSNWTQEEIDKLTLADFNHMTVRDFAEGINPNNIKQDSAALEQFKQEVDTLAGYYEGSGAVLTDRYPNLSKELDDKLANYFLGDGQLSIEDYRKLYKIMHPSSSTPSQAAPLEVGETDGLIRDSISFSLTPEEIAAAQKMSEEKEKPLPERPKSAAYESALDVKDSRIAQFNRVFSPQQIKDRGAMISNIFSRIIDEYLYDLMDEQLDIIDSEDTTEKEKDQAKRELRMLKDPINGRQYAAEKKGIENILDEIKQELEWNKEAATEEMKQLWQNTIDYFNDLFNTQATLDIEEREGIRIIGLETTKQNVSENDNDAQNDGDDEVGHVVSGSDGWNFQVRYTNPFDSLSRKVRSMLYEIERPQSEKDDLGQSRTYPMGRIYASLLSYLAKNMQDSDAFLIVDKSYEGQDRWGNDITKTSYPNGYPTFPVLEQMKQIYPWVQQVIDRLTDDYMNPEWNTNLRYPSTGGSMASQFYTNFRKAYIPYGKIQIGAGKFGITPLNYEMEERVQYDKLEANYNNRMILTNHSIYGSDGKINKENAEWLKTQLEATVAEMDRNDYPGMLELMEYQSQNPDEEVITEEDIQEYDAFIDKARMLLQSFGIDATQDSVAAYLMMDNGKILRDMLGDLGWIATTVINVADDKVDSYNYILDTRDRYGSNLWSHFFDGRGLITDDSYMQSFYDSASKKTKYSYSADNYLMKTFRGTAMGTLEQRRAYIDEHFGKYEWFKNQKTGEWRNKWLEFWYNYTGDQKEIPYRNIDNVTEYGNDGEVKIRQYSKWEPDDVWQVQDRSYAPESDSKTAFYLTPIFSDSPMSMTVKGPKMSMDELLYGYNDNDGHHQGAIVQLVNQELWRIGYVQERVAAITDGKVKPIANFDTGRGMQFCFLPELNSYVFEDTGESFLARMIRLKAEKATMAAIEESEIQAIQDVINRKMGEYYVENNSHYTADNPLSAEQYYNMVYANAAIIQMTTVDLAFYKNDTDFQKRFKEVYAGGIQLNTNSKYGKKTENIILLSDDIITSPSYDKIAAIIDNSTVLSESDKKEIKASFTDINVADAQAIRSMHSFRSVLDMMGNWTDEMETALQHFKDGTWDRADFDIIYQTIKPFVYSVIERNDGNGGSILVPQQNKNSEICALMMYDLITNGLNDSPVYKALSRFMEENLDAEGNHLIDMSQFESAGKVGNQGVINISFNPSKVVDLINGEFYDTKEGNEIAEIIDSKGYEFYTAEVDANDFLPNNIENAEANYYAVKHQMDLDLQKGRMSQEDYNKIIAYLRPTEDEIISMLEQAALITNPDGTKSINPEAVHTIPFDNYYQQTPTPEHHIDAEATFGSQARNLSVADLPDDFEMSIKVKGGTHTFKGRDAIIDFYYELLNENLIEDFFGNGNKKGLKDIFASKEALRDAVTEIVRGNPKYGRDFAEALQLDDNGNFVLNPNSPTIFNLMQEIVTSFFKNRITKQTINGAALIQAAGIGLDKDLRVVFDKDGKLVGAECLMPLTSKRFFEPLLETKIIDGKEVKVLDPKKLKEAGLDKAIGYRIPTENKSSMMPLIIKDFTPLQNGSAIVLPAEITDIAGSDFDVDKMFIMLLSFYIQTHDMRKARETWANQQKVIKELSEIFYNSDLLDEVSEADPQEFREWFEEYKDEFELATPRIHKIEYNFSKSPKENGRKARNNMLIQMIFGILTSKEGSEQLFNPQGFKDFKRAAKINRILTDNTLKEQLIRNTEGANPGVLPPPNAIIGEFLTLLQEKYPDRYEEYKTAVMNLSAEQVQQLYIQAITAGNKQKATELLLNSSTKDLEKFISDYSAPESPVYPQTFAHSHARNMAGANQIGIYAIQASMCAKYQRADVRLRPEQQFTLNGRVIANVDVSDGGSRLKNVGQPLGASADNGKDPNLADAGSTTKTAPIIGYMLRTGMSHLEAVLIINQPHMQMSKHSSKNKYWKGILGKTPLATPVEVTTDMLIKSLFSPFELTPEEDKAIAGLCYRVLMQHEAQEYLTQISRADSPNGSMQNSYAKARIQRYKVDLFNAKMGQKDFPFVRIKEALNNDAIDTTASEDVIREQLKDQRMAFLHGMYALGINSFNSLVSPYFFGAQQWFDDEIVKPILYNLNETTSDDIKESIVNAIYTSYITYTLSESSLFGNEENSTMKEKRAYYLETFPSDYQKIIQENEDIRDLLSNILQVKQFGSRKRIILQDVGSLSKGQKQDVQRRFDSLIYSDNPVARNLAKDLLIYSYFDNGLQFTHDSFSHLFTTEFLTNFPAYTDTLDKLDEKITPEEEENFIYQFLLTYPEAAYNVSNIISSDDVNNNTGTIRIDLNNKNMRKRMINEVMSPNPQLEGINVYPYIQYQGEVYVLDKNMFDQYPGTPIYHKLTPYQTYSRLPLFSISMSVAEMAKEFPVGEEQQETPDVGTVDAPMAHNEGDGDPNVGPDSMYDSFDSMDDFDLPDDVEPDAPQSDAEKYQSEGKGELNDPFC